MCKSCYQRGNMYEFSIIIDLLFIYTVKRDIQKYKPEFLVQYLFYQSDKLCDLIHRVVLIVRLGSLD